MKEREQHDTTQPVIDRCLLQLREHGRVLLRVALEALADEVVHVAEVWDGPVGEGGVIVLGVGVRHERTGGEVETGVVVGVSI